MRTVGKLIKGTTVLSEQVYEIDDNEGSYQERLEKVLLEFVACCRLRYRFGCQRIPVNM